MSDSLEPRGTPLPPGKSLVRMPHSRPTWLLGRPAWLALVVAALALIAVVVGWIDFSRIQRAQSLRLNVALQTMNQRLQTLAQSVALRSELHRDISTMQLVTKNLDARLDAMGAAVTDLRRRSEQGRNVWIKAEAASLLMDANEQIQLNADPSLAIKALTAADKRLRLLPDPRLIPVRRQIALELTTLRAVPQPDITGMAINLGSLSATVNQLPLKRVAPDSYTPNSPGGTASHGSITLWDRLKAGLQRLFRDIFTIHHPALRIEPLLAPRQEYFLRLNLQLHLDTARTALLERDNRAFHDSIALALDWLHTYFDARSRGVQGAITALLQMQHQNINPPLPDISASLTLLRQVESPRNEAP